MTSSLFLPKHYAPNIRTLTVSGIVQASPPISPVDSHGDFELNRALEILLIGAQYYPNAQAYQVVGHSMSGLIEHGDIVLVNPNDEFNFLRPCIFETPNGYVVKMRGLHKGKPALLSHNRSVQPITDMTDFRSRGSVYGVYLKPFTIRGIS